MAHLVALYRGYGTDKEFTSSELAGRLGFLSSFDGASAIGSAVPTWEGFVEYPPRNGRWTSVSTGRALSALLGRGDLLPGVELHSRLHDGVRRYWLEGAPVDGTLCEAVMS